MVWENLVVDRLVVHEVHERRSSGAIVPPQFGKQLLRLSQDALGELADRIMSAIGSQSQSMAMVIRPAEAGALIKVVDKLAASEDDEFVDVSRRFAEKLTEAQATRQLPGGMLVVFDGTVGQTEKPFVGVIKAETHSGFHQTTTLDIRFIKKLFLTPQTKLYKLGIFVCDDRNSKTAAHEAWSATIYDNQMSSANRDGAAQYFYYSFLGCDLPSTASRLTRVFFESTSKFIKSQDISDEEKYDLTAGLYSYLKVDQSTTINAGVFATQFIPRGLRDSYARQLARDEVPANSIQKDLSEISKKLKRRRLKFSNNIQLFGPSDAFDSFVSVRDTEVEAQLGHGRTEMVPATEIIIRGRVQDQE